MMVSGLSKDSLEATPEVAKHYFFSWCSHEDVQEGRKNILNRCFMTLLSLFAASALKWHTDLGVLFSNTIKPNLLLQFCCLGDANLMRNLELSSSFLSLMGPMWAMKKSRKFPRNMSEMTSWAKRQDGNMECPRRGSINVKTLVV